MIFIENNHVYETVVLESGIVETKLIGAVNIEEIIENEKIFYTFSEEDEEYIETGREPYEPPPSEEEKIEQLEQENALLALELIDTQIRLEESESEQAALLLELVEKGVI